MKRSAFKCKAPPRREATQMTYSPRPRAVAVAMVDTRDKMVVPVPKPEIVRDKEYLRLVSTLKCAWCGVVGRTQVAHKNHGKAMGGKTSDAEVFPLCGPAVGEPGCHSLLDQGGVLKKDQRRELEDLWANQTRMTLRKLAQFDAGARRVVERAIGL